MQRLGLQPNVRGLRKSRRQSRRSAGNLPALPCVGARLSSSGAMTEVRLEWPTCSVYATYRGCVSVGAGPLTASRDDDDFAAYVRLYGRRLLRTALLLTGNEDDAEELLQSVLTRALLRWGTLRRDPEALERYLNRSLLNARVSLSRKAHLRWEVLSGSPGSDDRTQDAFAVTDDRAELVAALQLLPRRQRGVVVLRYYVGLSERETAEVLQCSVGTVKSQSHKGLAALKDKLSRSPSSEWQESIRGS